MVSCIRYKESLQSSKKEGYVDKISLERDKKLVIVWPWGRNGRVGVRWERYLLSFYTV